MSSIRVGQDTKLEDLQRFAGAADGGAKIRARRHADGSFTLYASTRRSFGIRNFLFGQRAERRAAARDAVTTVLSSVQGARLERAMSDVLAGLPREGELRGRDLVGLLDEAAQARRTAASPRSRSDLAAAARDALAGGRPDELKELAVELGEKLAKQMRRLPQEQQLDAVMSRGDATKNQLLRELAGSLGAPGPLAGSYRTAAPAVKAFLDNAYDHAMTQLSDRRIDDDHVSIGGTTYTRERELTSTGFGAIELYRADSGDQIVLKRPTLEPGKPPSTKFDEAAAELSAHRIASAGDPANVIGLKGALRGPDGTLQIAIEYAPGGDAFRLIEKTEQALEKGEITQREANLVRLTMFKDMVEGVRHLQDSANLVHLDVKSPNFFVAAGGVVKLGDFGTAAPGDLRELYRSPIDNPRWASPEFAAGSRDAKRRINQATGQYRAAQRAALAKVNQLKEVISGEELAILKQDVRAAYAIQIKADVGTFTVTGKTDTWSLGIDAYRMFLGKFPFEDPGGSDVRTENLVIAHHDDDGRVGVPGGADIGLGKSPTDELGRLLRGMLHPDPAKRPGLAEVLDSPLLQQPGVGGAEARRLIQRLAA